MIRLLPAARAFWRKTQLGTSPRSRDFTQLGAEQGKRRRCPDLWAALRLERGRPGLCPLPGEPGGGPSPSPAARWKVPRAEPGRARRGPAAAVAQRRRCQLRRHRGPLPSRPRAGRDRSAPPVRARASTPLRPLCPARWSFSPEPRPQPRPLSRAGSGGARRKVQASPTEPQLPVNPRGAVARGKGPAVLERRAMGWWSPRTTRVSLREISGSLC